MTLGVIQTIRAYIERYPTDSMYKVNVQDLIARLLGLLTDDNVEAAEWILDILQKLLGHLQNLGAKEAFMQVWQAMDGQSLLEPLLDCEEVS